jgi:hypothetical protein
MGLFSPSEGGFRLESTRDARGHGASFVLQKQHSACQSGGREGHGSSFAHWKQYPSVSLEAMRGMGLICPSETAFSLDVVRGREGPGSSFVLWKRIPSVSLEAMRGLGPHFSFGSSIQSLSLEAARGREEPWGLICPSEMYYDWMPRGETGYLLQVPCCKGYGPVLSFGNRIASGGRDGL